MTTDPAILSAVEALLDERLGNLRSFVDRRISEVSAEVVGTIELIDINDGRTMRAISQVHGLLHGLIEDGGSKRELQVISEATSKAAEQVLACAEQLDALVTTLPLSAEQKAALRGISTRLFEASYFQDLVGQNVAKVSDRLHRAEEALEEVAGGEPQGVDTDDFGGTVSQDDVDRFFG